MMTPEILLVESDHDLRNAADFLVLDKLAKAVFAVPGVSSVQAITRPTGAPIAHTSIPYMLSMQNAGMVQNMQFQKDRMKDMLKQADELAEMVNIMQRMYGLMQQMTATTHRMVGKTHEMASDHGRVAGSHFGFRRYLAADPQLFLLGKALPRYSHLLFDEIHIRYARRR